MTVVSFNQLKVNQKCLSSNRLKQRLLLGYFSDPYSLSYLKLFNTYLLLKSLNHGSEHSTKKHKLWIHIQKSENKTLENFQEFSTKNKKSLLGLVSRNIFPKGLLRWRRRFFTIMS